MMKTPLCRDSRRVLRCTVPHTAPVLPYTSTTAIHIYTHLGQLLLDCRVLAVCQHVLLDLLHVARLAVLLRVEHSHDSDRVLVLPCAHHCANLALQDSSTAVCRSMCG